MGRQESSNEDGDRTWRRWRGFQRSIGFTGDPFLADLSLVEQNLLAKAFLQAVRTCRWGPDGTPLGLRPNQVVANTVRQAASSLGASFRGHFQQSPFHLPGSPNLRPVVRSLLAAFTNADPAARQQRAITPKLLRAMFSMAGVDQAASHDSNFATISELAIVGFFYAMRSCEVTTTPTPGRTRIIALGGVVFRNAANEVVPHDHPRLAEAERVTVTFRNQKNGTKNDKRTHQRTLDPVMCPVRRLASVVQRIYRRIPHPTPETTINTAVHGDTVVLLPSSFLLKHLRTTCSLLGGTPTFGYDATDIGTRSLRSGAAMALFLMNHSVTKIMLLGRWSSDAFLKYIRPQVFEWTNLLSRDMIHHNSFFDATDPRRAPRDTPHTRQRRPSLAPLHSTALHLHH